MVELEHFENAELFKKINSLPVRTIVETPFYGNNVTKIESVAEAYELAKNSPGTLELTGMPVYKPEAQGLPKGANVNFYELTGPDTVLEKTYERGVEDFTLACGTGTGAVVTVLTLLGKVSGRNVRVRMDGGELAVDAEAHDGRIENLYLTGPAALVCAGEILDKTILDLIKKQEEKA